MKINHKILNLPPYLSTSWKNISSIFMKKIKNAKCLVITLKDETVIEIPDLDSVVVKEIFSAHGKFLEQDQEKTEPATEPPKGPFPFQMPFQMPLNISGADGIEHFGNMMQHNLQMANTPDLPASLLEKVSQITTMMGLDENALNMFQAEPHCNCPHCQLARAIHKEHKAEIVEPEDLVSDEDLTFRDWVISGPMQDNEKLYEVNSPITPEEHYQVYLGDPIGCTCGQKNCEHIKAVLQS